MAFFELFDSLSLNSVSLRLLSIAQSLSQRIAELCRERETQSDSTTAPLGGHSEEPPQGLALQLADSRAKLRRLKQQLWVCVCVCRRRGELKDHKICANDFNPHLL